MSASPGPELTLYRQEQSLGRAQDLDFGLEMLRRARSGLLEPSLRLYRPGPTLALGQRDANLPGFETACDAARKHGFEPLVRKAGGRAAAYHSGCLVVDHVEPQADAMVHAKARFSHYGELFARTLRTVGVDAAVGEIPGEYCPGEFSVHGNGVNSQDGRKFQLKLVGTAQRVVAGAWFFSSVIIVHHSPPLHAVLTDSYAALGLSWDPATAGAAEDLVPGLTVETVAAAVVAEYGRSRSLSVGNFEDLLGTTMPDMAR